MRFGSVCSGIEAASVAWHPLGWHTAFVSEIDRFPSAVLAHRFPDVPNRGDMTKFEEWPDAAIDVLVGGTPCQSFSVAGLRKGLADPRGNLMLTFGAIAARFRPRWLVWENVPGVLSSNGGRDFGTFLGMLAELGYGFAYRVLDAQFFGVAQRRRRVFVVGYLGNWTRAAAVLFERESLSGHPAPRREARERPAPTLSARPSGGGGLGTDFDLDGGLITSHDPACTLTAREYKGALPEADLSTVVAHALRGEGFDASEDGTGRGTPLVAFHPTQTPISSIDVCHAIGTGSSGGTSTAAVATPWAVRRLTPRECERLQGFPDDWTRIPYRNKPADQCPDGPRYKALGNSMAVPVMRWIGERIEMVEALDKELAA